MKTVNVWEICQNEAPIFAFLLIDHRWRERIHGWWPFCKNRNWDCVSTSFFTFGDKGPWTPLHWDSPCGTLIRSVQNSLIRYLWWLEYCTWIAKNVSLCPRQIPRIRWLGRGSTLIEDLERLPADWEREKMLHCQFFFLKFSWIIHAIDPFLQLLYLWSELLYRIMTLCQFFVQRICQLAIPEVSSFHPVHEYF